MSTVANNLKPHQYQIGNVVFGRNTMLPVESVEVAGYEVNAQDFQVVMSDETRFGVDSIKPVGLIFTMALLINEALPNLAAVTGDPEMNFDNDMRLGQLMQEWRGDEVRLSWGELKPLLFCRKNGEVVRIYGRPRKFAYRKPTFKSQFTKITAEYMRSDTFAYSDIEYAMIFVPGVSRNVIRQGGDASAWVRFGLIGPMVHPIINFGGHQFELDISIEAGETVEVSTYPWQRRIVSSVTGLSLAAYLISDRPYLDQIKLSLADKTVSFTATGATGASQMVLLWREAYHSLD